jgi:hypothetical protein
MKHDWDHYSKMCVATTADISDGRCLRLLLAELMRVFESPVVKMVRALPGDRMMEWKIDDVNAAEIAKLWLDGGLAFEGTGPVEWDFGGEWCPAGEARSRRVWNKFHLGFSQVWLREQGGKVHDLVRFIAALLPVDFLAISHGAERDWLGARELGAGLMDICWLMVLGQPHVELIGRDKLSRLPVHHVEAIGHGALMIQFTEQPLAVSSAEWQELQARFKAEIGLQYFRKYRPPMEDGVPRSFWILNVVAMVRFLRSSRRLADNANNNLESEAGGTVVTPNFTWPG